MGGLIVGIILILIGLSVLTGLPVIGFVFNVVIAIIFIMIGVRIIARGSARGSTCAWWHWDGHCHDGHSAPSGEDRIDEVAVFSPLNKSYTSEHFKGGKIVMVFSGGEIDLTAVKTDATEIVLEVSSVFSGMEIVVPKEWKVQSAVDIFAGNVDTSAAQGGDGPVTLTLRGDAVFGQIEVRK